MTFSDLKGKDVINVRDGRRLGKPIDLMFNEHACIEAIVVPAPSGFAGLFSRDRAGTVIPWSRICRLGDDVILVEIEPSAYEECR
ncbi:MAG: YlmC/YmxH family sporulation protein [Clostridia bacterium]